MERKLALKAWLAAACLALVGLLGTVAAEGAGVPRMSTEELKGMLGSPDLIVVDVRRGTDWAASEFKITGAVRQSGKDFSWAGAYPKDKTIVLYCA
jgi:hypothetical protein